jgi:hypothetical protein
VRAAKDGDRITAAGQVFRMAMYHPKPNFPDKATGPSQTTVTLTSDWSGVAPEVREHIGFPPFGPDHLPNSLQHLSEFVTKV